MPMLQVEHILPMEILQLSTLILLVFGRRNLSPFQRLQLLGANVTLTYHPNGGEGTMSSRTEPIGSKFNLDANAFTRTGHTFQGWSTRQDGGGGLMVDL